AHRALPCQQQRKNGGSREPVPPRWVAAAVESRLLGGVAGADEVAYPRQDLLAPLAAVEDAVVADARLLPMDVAGARNVGRQRVRRLGLADAGDVVELAFDGHQGGLDRRGIDLAAAAHPDAARQQ